MVDIVKVRRQIGLVERLAANIATLESASFRVRTVTGDTLPLNFAYDILCDGTSSMRGDTPLGTVLKGPLLKAIEESIDTLRTEHENAKVDLEGLLT